MRDWKLISEATITCRCGAVFRAKAQVEYANPERGIVTEKPCPACGATEGHRKLSSDPEKWTL
jgi:hypothetical protein